MWRGEQDAQQTPLSTYTTDAAAAEAQWAPTQFYTPPMGSFTQLTPSAIAVQQSSASSGTHALSARPPHWRQASSTGHSTTNQHAAQRPGQPRYFHHQQYQHQAFPAAAIVMQAPPYGLVGPRSPTVAGTAASSFLGPLGTAGAMPTRSVSSLAYGGSETLGWGGQSLGGGRPIQQQGRGGLQGRGFQGRGGLQGRGGGFDEGRASQQADAVIMHIISAIRSLPPGTPCHETAVASGLGTLDSRSAAMFIKQLAQAGMVNRAWELFNGLRSMQAAGTAGELLGLLDVYLYTAMISLCSNNKEVALAQELSREMAALGIPRNVHTFSALMNVAIKASQYQLALDIFEEMQAAGCQPNLVTFNTLIDVYGKLNKWMEAVRIVNNMRAMGIEPVIRTYNTLMIACNSSNQWQESLRVYQQVVESGLRPNTTTFNALIAAYSKAGNLDKVMEVFQQMVRSGCERSVITYSTLISACEKAGEWELALQLFGRMPQDGVRPNTITFNSLITACAQGSQWERAEEVFEQMGRLNCQPDVVSYTALITAYGRGAQWRRALDAFARMQRARCAPDHVVYEAVIEVLWETGVHVAQRCAVGLYRASVHQGLARQQQQHAAGPLPALRPAELSKVEPRLDLGPDRSDSQLVEGGSSSSQPAGQQQQQRDGETGELLLGTSSSSNMAMVSLLCWLADARELVRKQGPGCLPKRLVIRFGRTRQRELVPSGATLRTIVLGWLKSHRSPFKVPAETIPNTHATSAFSVNILEANGQDVEAWLSSPTSAAPAPAPTPTPPAGGVQSAGSPQGPRRATWVGAALARSLDLFSTPAAGVKSEDPVQTSAITSDLALEVQCCTAFSAVQRFEARYCLNVTAMGPAYVSSRHDLVVSFFKVGALLRCRRSLLHDAVLVLDRVMSSAVQLRPDMHLTALCAALLLVARQLELPVLPLALPSHSGGAGAQHVPPLPAQPSPAHPAVPPPAVASALSALPRGQGAAAAAAGWKGNQEEEAGGGAAPDASAEQAPGVYATEGVLSEASLSRVTGLTESSLRACQSTIRSTLAHDTAAISAAHSLHIYLARLGLATDRWQVMCEDEENIHASRVPPPAPLQQAPTPEADTQQQQQQQQQQQSGSTTAPPSASQPAPRSHSQPQLQLDIATAVAPTAAEPPLPRMASMGAVAPLMSSGPPAGSGDLEWDAYALLDVAVAAPDFLNFRPSVTAAAVLYVARLRAGELPLWPSSLAAVTGARTPAGGGASLGGDVGVGGVKVGGSLSESGVELSAAISAAQKLQQPGSTGARHAG